MALDVAQAQSLREMLTDLTKNHKRVLAAAASLEGAKERIEVARGDWYPNLDVTANYGHERQNKPTGADDTALCPLTRWASVSYTHLTLPTIYTV